MGIHFDTNRWAAVKHNYSQWWTGELDRPLIHMTVKGCAPDRTAAALPLKPFLSFYDSSVPADQIIDAIDFNLSHQRYLADAFPCTWLNFGAGVLATAIGNAQLHNGDHTVWFKPKEEKPIKDIHFAFDPDAVWFKRIMEIAAAAIQRWQGMVQVGMTDLGGNLDVMSIYRPSEALMLDLYDFPEEVKLRIWETHKVWWAAFDRLNAVLRPLNPGYTAWTPIFAMEPYYMLQCDFAYMISPEMFDEFVRPELAASCKRLKHAFYHLDGVGQLPHLDSLLSIPELKGIQWIPGDGKPDQKQWPEVYRKIRAAGKLIQIHGGLDVLDVIADQVGSAKGIILIGSVSQDNESSVREQMQKYMR